MTRAPSRAAVSAAKSPAAPAPTTTRSAPRPREEPVRYPACPGPLWLRHDARRSPTTSPAIPSGRSGSSRWRRRWSAHDWFGCDARARRPRRRASSCCARAPGGARRLHRGAVRARRRARSTATPSRSPATYEAALRAAGGAVALVDALLGGEAATGVLGAAPARPPRRARRGRWGSASSATSAVAARHARAAHGVERVLILDWDVHHGNGTNDDLPRRPERAVRLDPRVAAVSGDRAGVRRRVGRRARATRSTCRSRAGRATTTYRSLVEHVVLPLIAAWEPELVLVSRRLRRALATTRSRPAGSPRRGYAGMTASLRRACDGGGRAARAGARGRLLARGADAGRWRR